jgi:hypothetical protein
VAARCPKVYSLASRSLTARVQRTAVVCFGHDSGACRARQATPFADPAPISAEKDAGAKRASWHAPESPTVFYLSVRHGNKKQHLGWRPPGALAAPNDQRAQVCPIPETSGDLWSADRGLGRQNLVRFLRHSLLVKCVLRDMSERHGSADVPGICGRCDRSRDRPSGRNRAFGSPPRRPLSSSRLAG